MSVSASASERVKSFEKGHRPSSPVPMTVELCKSPVQISTPDLEIDMFGAEDFDGGKDVV